jgi:hypothetical protein
LIEIIEQRGIDLAGSGDSLIIVKDNLSDLHRHMKSLQEIIIILESGFEAINDDNCNYVISSLMVVEEQLGSMGRDLSDNIDAIASMIEAKGV